MGKRTLVHITKDLDGYYKWTGRNAECCVVAVHENAYVTDDRLQTLVSEGKLTIPEYQSICSFDGGHGTISDLKTIEKIVKRLNLKIVMHEVKPVNKITASSSEKSE